MLAASSQEEWQSAELALARMSPRQVFPSPGRDVLLKRLQGEARKHHFEVVSLKFLRPRQFAPMVVVRTTDYVSFAATASSILARLEPDYEGVHLEAQDEFGVPFLATYMLARSFSPAEKYPGWGLPFARSDPLKQALQRGFMSASAAPAPTDVQPTPAAAGASNAPPKAASESP